MRILFIVKQALDLYRGGMERVTILLGERFRQDGHTVFFLSCVHDRQGLPDQLYFPDSANVGSFENSSFLSNLVQQEHIDIIINQQADISGLSAMCRDAAQTLGSKVITVLHFDPHHYEKINQVPFLDLFRSEMPVSQKIRFVLRGTSIYQHRLNCYFSQLFNEDYLASDAFVVLSDYCSAEFLKMTRINDSSHLFAIPNPVTISFSPTDAPETDIKQKIILWVGRMSFGDKRPDLMLQIWQHLVGQFPDWKLYMIGDGEYMPYIQRKVASSGIQNVHLLGQCDSTPFYQTSQVLCMTSTTEGMPLVIQEAAHYKIPAVVFDTFSSIRSMVDDGETGYIVPAYDISAFCNRLRFLMSNPENLLQMGSKAYEKSQHFRIDQVVSHWYQLFSQL